jgi:hypothetical protein
MAGMSESNQDVVAPSARLTQLRKEALTRYSIWPIALALVFSVSDIWVSVSLFS